MLDCTHPSKRRKWNPTEFDLVTETIDTLEHFYRRINLEYYGESLNQLLNTNIFSWAEKPGNSSTPALPSNDIVPSSNEQNITSK